MRAIDSFYKLYYELGSHAVVRVFIIHLIRTSNAAKFKIAQSPKPKIFSSICVFWSLKYSKMLPLHCIDKKITGSHFQNVTP